MPGEISQSHQPRICKCEHFESVHEGGQCSCGCTAFEEMPFEDTELGKAIDAWLSEPAPWKISVNRFTLWYRGDTIDAAEIRAIAEVSEDYEVWFSTNEGDLRITTQFIIVQHGMNFYTKRRGTDA